MKTNPTRRQLDWTNLTFLVVTPLIAAIGIPVYVYHFGIHWGEIALLAFLYLASGYGITVGYHRLFSHKTYEAHPMVRLFLLVAGAMACQNSAYKWSADHRIHHQHVDSDADPYNAKNGFWFSHILWVFYKEPEERNYDNVVDLEKDPLVMWQHRYYLPLVLIFAFALPAVIGLGVGRPIGFVLWAGVLRIVLVHHSTFFINSLAHICGHQTYDDRTTARDSWWLALFTFGEGFHNYHHRFQADYRNGVRWYHFDPSKWIIFCLSKLGLAHNLRRYSRETVLLTRLKMDLRRVENRLAKKVPPTKWEDIARNLQETFNAVEKNLNQWSESMQAYWQEKTNHLASPQMCMELKKQAQIEHENLKRSLRQWKQTVRFYLNQQPPLEAA